MRPLLKVAVASIILILVSGCVTNKDAYETALHDPLLKGDRDEDGVADKEGPPYSLASLSPVNRPPLDSDEAGLWMAMDKHEASLKTAGNLIRDEPLNAYVKSITCRLVPEYCNDLRVYLVRVPHFNATMAPNGVLQVWSGLLLRVHNEAQLAAVLGHEIGHYLRRHSLQRMRDTIEKTNFLVFFRLAMMGAGVGVVGDIATLVGHGSIAAFGRDHEREADGYGIALMARAGYDPREAAKVWELVKKETDASENKKGSLVFATHPPSNERKEALERLAAKVMKDAGGAFEKGTQRFRKATDGFRSVFLDDEIRLHQFAQTIAMLDIRKEQNGDSGLLKFYRGEAYRIRGKEEDLKTAIAAYKDATASPDYPAEAFRSLGSTFAKVGNNGEARRAYAQYLKMKPGADDRQMIEYMMRRL